MSTTKNKRKAAAIRYGSKDVLTAEDLKEGVKVRISMMIDVDLLRALKARAEGLGIGYQTMIHRMLRDQTTAPGASKSVEERVSELEEFVKTLRTA